MPRVSRAAYLRQWRSQPVVKQCAECGADFQSQRNQSRLCDECKISRRAMFRPQTFLSCKQCGQTFGPVDHLTKQYCSKACKYAAAKGQPSKVKGTKRPQRARIAKCLTCGVEFRGIKDTKRRRQLYCSHACYLRNRHQSNFEDRVIAMVTGAGIPVERQAKRGRWTFDGAITGTAILIEADGAYWHSSEKVKARDARKDAWCMEHGYILVRVPELAFYKDPTGEIDVIIKRWEAETGQQAERIDG